jgi:hypothetical protein
MLQKAGFVEVVGRKNFCATFDDGLVRAKKALAESGDSQQFAGLAKHAG